MQRSPIALRRTVLALGAAWALLLITGCTETTHVHGGGNGGGGSSVEVFVELEPNDSPAFPDFVAVLDDLDHIVVEGSVEAIGFDIVDHIEFEAAYPLEIDFSALALSPGGDVDVTIYDPISGQVLGTYAVAGDYEAGTIVVHEGGRPFQFIIEAYGVATDWDLELITYPYCGSCLAPAGDGPEALQGSGDDAPSDAETRPWIEVIPNGTPEDEPDR